MVYFISLFWNLFNKPKNWLPITVLFLPLIDTLHNLLPGKHIGGEYIKQIALIFVFWSVHQSIRHKKQSIFESKYGKFYFLAFIIVLLNSLRYTTDFFYSFPYVINFILVLSTYWIYSAFFKYNDDLSQLFHKFLDIVFKSAVIWVFYIIVVTLLKYGRFSEDYDVASSDIIYFGHANFYGLFPMLYLLIASIYYLNIKVKSKSTLVIFISLSATIIFLLLAKRTYLYIFLFASGFQILFFSITHNKKFNVFTIFLIIALFFVIGKDTYIKTFLEKRGSSLERSYFEEGRFLEILAFKSDIIDREATETALFGTEIFNTEGKFFGFSYIYSWLYFDKDKRTLHSDYSFLLYGTGMVGTLFYLLFIIWIGINFYRKNKYEGMRPPEIKALIFVFWSIYISLVLNGLSDGILAFSNRFIPFMLLGAISGYFSNIKQLPGKIYES